MESEDRIKWGYLTLSPTQEPKYMALDIEEAEGLLDPSRVVVDVEREEIMGWKVQAPRGDACFVVLQYRREGTIILHTELYLVGMECEEAEREIEDLGVDGFNSVMGKFFDRWICLRKEELYLEQVSFDAPRYAHPGAVED